ncbi:MAG: L,D-transpeptidase family protein [Croceibacterium sp.]
MRRKWVLALLFGCVFAPAVAGPIQQIDIPASRQHGLDMILVDEDSLPAEPELARQQGRAETFDEAAPTGPVNPLYTQLSSQLDRYRERWSALPQVMIANDRNTIAAAADPRIGALRQRLGLAPQGGLDKPLVTKLTAYQQAHGLAADGKASGETLASLNRGAAYYEGLIRLNMERARRLPASDFKGKYVLVDAGAARLWLYEDGHAVDSMKVVVGAPATETPMLAAMMRFSSVNPYWNVPPELIRKLIAKNVLEHGMTYLSERAYQVLDGWTEDAPLVDPTTVDWQAVADGKQEIRVRQLPGGANSMGKIKFMMPNEYGIYLHDTPNKAPFAETNRWISNGCIRVEDAGRLARWLYGEMPQGATPDREERVDLARPVPVYVTYFTVATDGKGLAFRADPYKRDAALLARFGATNAKMIDSDAVFRKAMAL